MVRPTPNMMLILWLAVLAFGIDLLTGTAAMAGAAFYPAAVLAASLRGGPRRGPVVAGACSLLAALALLLVAYFGTGPADLLAVLLNRAAVLAAIWVVAGLGATVGRQRADLRQAQGQLGNVSDRLAQTEARCQRLRSELDETFAQLNRASDKLIHSETRLAQAEATLQRRVDERSAALGQAKEDLRSEITQRQQTEMALQDAKAQYASLIESLALHMIRKDSKGRFTYASPSFCRLLGKSLEQIRGKTDQDLFPKALAEKYMQDDRTVLQTKTTFEDIEVHPGKDGQKMYVQIMKTPILDAEGNAVGLQGLFWDVTDRKSAEIGMRESEARKRAIFEAAMDCIVFIDLQGQIVEFNRASEDTFGYSRKEVIGREMSDVFVPPESRQRLRSNLLRYSGEGEMGSMLGRRLETPMIKKNGQQFIAEMAAQPIPLAGSTGFAVFVRDITQRKQAEEALTRAKEAAELASKSKGAFLANMSHEIRTPMNAIIGMTEFVLGTELGPQQCEYLQMVLESGNSLLALLNDILDFSKIEAGKLDLESLPFALRPWLSDSIKSQEFRAKEKKLDFRCEVAAETPEYLIGDPHRLRQIMVNLVTNAIKFTERGGVTVRVRPLDQDPRQATLLFEVRDTGIGIPPDKCKTVFLEFEQADNSTKRRFGGTGLGLSICSRLVELMDGRISVRSVVGQGSLFQFTARLGIGQTPPARPETVPVAASPATAGNQTLSLTILLAEDSAMNQRLALGLLQRKGHRVVVANNGRQAVEAFRSGRFDLVLMDVQMPEMDGFEATEAIRAFEAGSTHTPVVAMTAYAMKGDRERCLDAGMDDYLSKPIRSAELDALLARVAHWPAAIAPPPQAGL